MLPTQLIEELKDNKQKVDELIFEFLPKESDVEEIALLYEMMKEYPSQPGKGIRSFLCLETCEAFGGKSSQALITAAALELFHNWILIHDDIEDDSSLRRGKPVLHKKYSIPLANNAGDALHGKMWELLMRNASSLGFSKTLAIMNEAVRMVNETTEGQHIELAWVVGRKWDLLEEDYYLMCEKKTSWFTCITPCRMGAIIAGAKSQKLDKLITFGRDLGIAFQIRDDVLNLVGNEFEYGKEKGGDIFEGKRTLILIHLLKVLPDGKEKTRILKIMNKTRAERTEDDVEYIISIMKNYGAINYAQDIAKQRARRARAAIGQVFRGLPISPVRKSMMELIDFMIFRDH